MVQAPHAGAVVTRERMALAFPLGGQTADPHRHLSGLRLLGKCNRLRGIVAVESDKCVAHKAIHGEVVVAALISEVDRAPCPPQGSLLVSCLLYQPTHVFRVPGPKYQQASAHAGCGAHGQLLKRVGLRDQDRQQEPGGGSLAKLPILIE